MAIKDLTKVKKHLFICNSGSCNQNGAAETTKTIREEIKKCGLHDQIHTSKTMCNGRCDDGTIVIVMPDNIWYKNVSAKVGKKIVYEHLKNDKPIEDFVLWRFGNDEINVVK
jgi:(2Fe-2S) ferredoxin